MFLQAAVVRYRDLNLENKYINVVADLMKVILLLKQD